MSQVSSAFAGDPELIQELEKRSEPMPLPADRILFRQGDAPDGVYVLTKGFAVLTSETDDQTVIRMQAGAGSLLGLPAVIGSRPYTLTAEAIRGAEVKRLSCSAFVELMRSDPALAFRVLQIMAAEVRFARQSLAHS